MLFIFLSHLQIKKFNLNVALFIKELNAYAQNVNQVDDESIKLLIEAIVGINKLQTNSTFCEASLANESAFVNNLNDDIFMCQQIIVCSLCLVSTNIHFTNFIFYQVLYLK